MQAGVWSAEADGGRRHEEWQCGSKSTAHSVTTSRIRQTHKSEIRTLKNAEVKAEPGACVQRDTLAARPPAVATAQLQPAAGALRVN